MVWTITNAKYSIGQGQLTAMVQLAGRQPREITVKAEVVSETGLQVDALRAELCKAYMCLEEQDEARQAIEVAATRINGEFELQSAPWLRLGIQVRRQQ